MAKARVKYIGNGSFIPKIPARDLSTDEVRRFGLKRLLESGLYQDLYPPRQKKKRVVIEEPEPEIVQNKIEED